MCGNTGKVQAHHIIPRHIRETRYDINNGILLCFCCHKMGVKAAHQNAIYFSEWLKKRYFAQWEYLNNLLIEIYRPDKNMRL